MATTLGSEEIKKTHPEIMPPDTNVITSQSMPQRFSVTPREIKLKIITVADIVKCVISVSYTHLTLPTNSRV